MSDLGEKMIEESVCLDEGLTAAAAVLNPRACSAMYKVFSTHLKRPKCGS